VRLAAAAVTVVVVVAIAAVLVIRGRGPALDPMIVVVAPFENQIRDTSLAQLGAITADWIAQVLQGTGAIKVVPTASVAATRWVPGANPRDLAVATGAGTVITGRASLQGDSVYLRADVVHARTGALLYSVPPVAADKRRPLVAVTELARRLGGAVAVILDPEAATRYGQVRAPTSYEAYRAFSEGLRWLNAGEWQRSWTEFQRAYALDTTFLRALIEAAGMRANANDVAGSDSLMRFVDRRRDRLTRIEQSILAALRAANASDYQAAIAAARELARLVPPREGLYFWGYTAVVANRPAEAVHVFTSDYANAAGWWAPGAGWLAAAYHLLGRHRDELNAAQRGRRDFPRSLVPINAALAALAALGRDEDVFRLLDEARDMEPDPSLSPEFWGGAGPWQPYVAALEFRAHGRPEAYRRAIQLALDQVRGAGGADTAGVAVRSGRALVLYAAERWEEARAVYAGLHAADSMNVDFLGALGVSEARLGHRTEAERLAGRLATINPPFSFGRTPYWRARIAALLGDRDGAVALLREAVAHGQVCTVRWGPPWEDCHREMDFESLRGYAPFVELLRPKG
jgi:TolB-like protein